MYKQTLTDSNWTLLDIDKNYGKITISTDNTGVQIARSASPAAENIIDMEQYNYYTFDFTKTSNPLDIYVKGTSGDVIEALYDVEFVGNESTETDVTDIKTAVESLDTKEGTTGEAADVDGTRAAQLRYIGEGIDTLETTANAIQTALEIMDDWDATEGSAASADGLQVMFEARSGQKTAVDNGDAVRPVTNLNGELVLAGYSWSGNSIRMEEVDPLNLFYDYIAEEVTNLADSNLHNIYIDLDGVKSASIQLVMSDGTSTDDIETDVYLSNDYTEASSAAEYTPVNDIIYGAATSTTAVDNTAGAVNNWYAVDTNFAAKWMKITYQRIAGSANDGDINIRVKVIY